MNEKQNNVGDKLAIIALVFSIISCLCCGGCIGWLMSFVLGLIALIDVNCKKKGIAIASIILSVIALIITIVLFIATIESSNSNKNDSKETYANQQETNSEESTTPITENSIDETSTEVETITQEVTTEIETTTQTIEENAESPYEYKLTFEVEGLECAYYCDADITVEIYDRWVQECPQGRIYKEYYATIPSGEYKVEFNEKYSDLYDQVAHLDVNQWHGISWTMGDVADSMLYTIENIPSDTDEVFYEPIDRTVINRTTEGDGRITIANGDTIIIEEGNKQILNLFFDKQGDCAIELYKLK